jgi:hypothetical protein
MNIWMVDGEAIRSVINARNAIRKAALLPLLDEQKEFEHACMLIRQKRWHAFKETKQSDYERFRDEVYTERGAPTDFSGIRSRHIYITQRLEAFLHANYADEIIAMMDIAPDYLAITRRIVEGPSDDDPAIELTLAPTETL